MQNVINYKNMQGSKKHFTKAEIESRKKASEKMNGNKLRKRPPEWISDEAKKEWKKILKDIEGFEIFYSTDENLISTYCITMVQYKFLISKNLIMESQKTLKILIQLSDKLGLSPNGRARLATKEGNEIIKTTKEDEFEL